VTEQHPAPLAPADVDLRTKRMANLVARAALAGWVIRPAPEHTIADGTLVAERWGHIRHLASLDEAERWFQQVAGKGGSPWGAYEAGKSNFLAANPSASADDIEEHAKRLARREGL
jgi:hypothetical protein